MDGRGAVVRNGFVVGFEAGSRRCGVCRRAGLPLELRGWVKVTALIVWQRERRVAAYACADCARRETIAALVHTALLGWWGVFALVFHAPRATLHNWRAAFAHPFSPGHWGALPAAQLSSPLGELSPGERQLVAGAEQLYERLGTARDAGTDEIRRAFRRRAKLVHPDTRTPDARAHQEMQELNRAWEILRSQPLRNAYDWLERERVTSG